LIIVVSVIIGSAGNRPSFHSFHRWSGKNVLQLMDVEAVNVQLGQNIVSLRPVVAQRSRNYFDTFNGQVQIL
jgi:hypothetical protein